MSQDKNSLFEAFHADHAVLGKGFHELSAALRSNDLSLAKQIAARLDADAGAHIAFEENHFYKALLPLLGAGHVEKMYAEHEDGLAVVQALIRSASMDESERLDLLAKSEAMETHISECGELFAAMGRIPAEEQQVLHRQLLEWREAHPRWTDFAATRER